MKVLKNYKIIKKEGYEEYPAIEIRYDDEEVFAELPLCVIPFGMEFNEPLLVSINQQGIANVADKQALIAQLKNHTQKVYFTLVDGKEEHVKIPRISPETTDLYMRLPKNDDPEKYVYDYRGGKIYAIERVEVQK